MTMAKARKKELELLPKSSKWYLLVPDLPQIPLLDSPSPSVVSNLQNRASSLLTSAQDANSLSNSSKTYSEATFYQTIITSGTLSDRLSALTLLVQGNPMQNLKALETLKGMAEKGGIRGGGGGREIGLKSLRCIVDWWVGGGAPDRKLRYFRDQSLVHPAVKDEHLLVWCFEDWLKKWFFGILQILEKLSADPLLYIRMQTLTLIHTLLKDRPEQEHNLLRLLAWKLGDTQRPICARSSHLLVTLLQTHPAMKAVVLQELSALVLRKLPSGKPPSLHPHLTYYALVTLNQIVLSTSGPQEVHIAREFVAFYFEVFREILKLSEDGHDDPCHEKQTKNAEDARKGRRKSGREKIKIKANSESPFLEIESAHSKLIVAALTGLRRALPFAQIEHDERIMKHIDVLFLITHQSTFNVSLQALILIQYICSSYRSLTTSRGEIAKSAHSLLTTSVQRSLIDRFYLTLYASLHDPRLTHASKQLARYLNLLFRSIRADPSGERQQAFVRRLVQVLVSGAPGGDAAAVEWVVGGLALLGELLNATPNLRSFLFNDTVGVGDYNSSSAPVADPRYDPLKRSPIHAHASASPLYELYPLRTHYHPTVVLYAKHILDGDPLPLTALCESGAPDLGSHTLVNFLDKFVFKNPKKNVEVGVDGGDGVEAAYGRGRGKGGSLMQPAACAPDGVKLIKGERGEKSVNDEAWWRLRVEDVPVDQVFYHKYFKGKHERQKGRFGERSQPSVNAFHEGGSTDESNEQSDFADEKSDFNEDEIWTAMQKSMPDIINEGLTEDDDDDVYFGPDIDDQQNSQDDLGTGDIGEILDSLSSIAEGSGDDDLPFRGLIEYEGSDTSAVSVSERGGEESWLGIGTPTANKKREIEVDTKSRKRKKRETLPAFASYEDYAGMIEGAPEDNL